MAAAENLVTANPDMDMIYATGEPGLIGAVAAVKAGGYEDKIKIVGWDLHKQVIQGIDEGFVVGVVQQNPYEEGYQAVLACLKLSNGEKIPEEILIPITIVTKENVDKYRDTFKKGAGECVSISTLYAAALFIIWGYSSDKVMLAASFKTYCFP